jgi:PBSX family phage terminase large subunit
MGESGAPLVVRFDVRGTHRDLMVCRDTEVAAVGRAGSGKTLAACIKLHLAAMMVPNLRGLMLRATHTSLTATTLVTFQRQVAAQALADGSVRWFGGSAKDPAAFRYANGSTILVAGGDRPEKFLSAELDRIFVDEAVEISLDLYETLISRLRGRADTYRQVMLATNPSHPGHWIKRRADEGTLKMITSTHRDNPHYVNRDGTYTDAGREYMEKLDALTGVRRLRLRDGLWTVAEGVIYDGWDESVHVVNPFPVPEDWPLYLTIDFGFVHPFAAQWWREDGDGRLYLVREIHKTRVLVEDHAKHIRRIMEQHPDEPRPRAVICDHDAEDRATLERHLGLPTIPARKTVSDGIQAVQARLRVQPDGRPRLMVFRDALVERDQDLTDAGKPACLADEIPGYVWDTAGRAAKERPVKVGDDACDAMRYVVAELDLIGSSTVRSPARPARQGRVSGAAARYGRPVVGKGVGR